MNNIEQMKYVEGRFDRIDGMLKAILEMQFSKIRIGSIVREMDTNTKEVLQVTSIQETEQGLFITTK